MAENPLVEALKALPDPDQAEPVSNLPTVQDIASSLAPLTQEAASRLSDASQGRQTVTRQAAKPSKEQLFQQENAAPMPPGVEGPPQPISTAADTTTVQGALGFMPLSTRFQLGRRREFMDQYEYLNQRFPDKVRLSKDGHDFIVKMPDEDTGGEKEVLVNDRSINLGDFAQLAGKAPEMAAGVLAAAVARRIPALSQLGPKAGLARDIVASSAGMETASALESMSVKAEEGKPIEAGEALKQSGKDFVVDLAFGTLTAGFAKTLNEAFKFLQAPFSFSRGIEQTAGLAAADRLEKELGTRLKYSLADSSGSPILSMGQSMIKSHPSSAAAAAAKLAEIDASKDATFRAITSGAKSDEEVGTKLIQELQGIRNVAEGQIEAMAGGVEASGSKLLQQTSKNVAGTEVGPGSGFSPIAKGKVTRDALEELHVEDLTQKNVKYADVKAQPGANDRTIPTDAITDKVSELRKNVPSRQVSSTVQTYNQYGGSGTATVKGTEPVSEFIHPEVKRFLSAKLDPEMNLWEMIKMRSMLYDEAAQGEAVQGIPSAHIRQVAGSITDAIQKWIQSPPLNAVKTKLKLAEDFYKSNVLRWEEPGFYDLFRKKTQGAGYVSDEAVIQRLKEQPSQFIETLKRVQGTSGEAALKGSVMDDVLNRSTAGLGSDIISGKALLANIDDLRLGKNKDVATAVFGNNLDALVAAGRRLAIGQGQITKEQARQLLASDKPSLAMVNDMFAATTAIQESYKNQLIKAYTVGKLDINTVNAEDALNSFLNTGTTSDIKWLINVAAENPDLAEQLPRKLIEQILRKAGPSIDDKSLLKVLKDPAMYEKYEAMLGPRRMDLLHDLAAALAPYRITKEYGAGTGIFAKGSATGKLMRTIIKAIFTMNLKGGTEDVKELIGFKMIALALTNPKVESWFMKTPVPMYEDLGKAVVISEPFLKALNEDVSDAAQKAGIVNSIRHMFGFTEPAGKAPPKQTDEQRRMQEFLKSGQF